MPTPTNNPSGGALPASPAQGPSGYPAASKATLALPPRYYGNIAYYARVAACGGNALMDGDRLFDKREKSAHRCDIADTHGPVQLTVPVGKPHGIPRATWSHIRVSDHGRWWHVHRVTLESAYGRTPFFEFYIDRFLPFLCSRTVELYPRLIDLDRAVDDEIRRILLLPTAPSLPTPAAREAPCNPVPGAPLQPFHSDVEIPPYYQVRRAELGFLPNLSILDLIFNLGPESPLYLSRLAATLSQSIQPLPPRILTNLEVKRS